MLLTLPIPESLANARLDAVLHAMQPQLSRTVARQLCELGAVAVDGVRAHATERPRAGSSLQFAAETVALTLQLGLPVQYADPDVMVLHKPAGLAVHAGPLVDDSVAQRLEALPGSGLAHRLDRGTSGLLLVGCHAAALRSLAAAMAAGAIAREYLAIAAGVIADDERTIDLPLRATDEPRGNQPKVLVDRDHGQPAITHVHVRDRRADCTLLEARLETGRTHQIRAHLAAIGHPLLGDPRYGDAAANLKAHQTFGIDRPMLHSFRLRLPLPRDGDVIELQAMHEPDFARMFRSLRPRPGGLSAPAAPT